MSIFYSHFNAKIEQKKKQLVLKGATAFGKMTLSITALSKTTSITTLNKMAGQSKDTQHNGPICDIQHNVKPSVSFLIMLSVIIQRPYF